ncbi:hypothetical protein CPB85DRAFT_1356164 [Mucidula mucida]|nr:hypothetical protein CPB85DRAFT_1356164 [Mucidula mucida]
MPAAKPAAPKRRNRKRKRRAASSLCQPLKITPSADHASSSSESSSSSSESDSDSDSDVPAVAAASITPKAQPQPQRSPSPPPAQIPSFIPPQKTDTEPIELEVKFRKFWMAAVADGFSEDLDELRKESNLSKARLEMLVHSLAAGTDGFSKDEMEVVLG